MKTTSKFKKLERSLYQAELLGTLYRIDKVKGSWTLLVHNGSNWETISQENSKAECEIKALKNALNI